MNIQKAFSAVMMGLILVGLLAACASTPNTGQSPETVTPGAAQESAAMTPIIGTAVEGGSPGQPLSTNTPPATVEGAQTITLADNSKTFNFQPGQRFVLVLDEGFTWEIQIVDTQVVDQVIGHVPVTGAQGVFEALQPGKTELNASGDPLCRNEKPACMRPSILFTITIVVK
jgi:hypothetical protein